MFGGNSNWRGPVWFPVNYLLIEALERYHHFYGDDFKVECPTGSGSMMNLDEVAERARSRLARALPADDERPPPGSRRRRRFADDPHWRDLVLFHEYFHGDDGRGLGASHQTGWTALVASLLCAASRTVPAGMRRKRLRSRSPRLNPSLCPFTPANSLPVIRSSASRYLLRGSSARPLPPASGGGGLFLSQPLVSSQSPRTACRTTAATRPGGTCPPARTASCPASAPRRSGSARRSAAGPIRTSCRRG